MNIFVTDTETTGLPGSTPPPKMIEFAGALYNVEQKAVLAIAQCLLYSPENPAAGINGITQELLETMNPDNPVAKAVQDAGRANFQVLYDQADYIIAHNDVFDKQFLEPEFGYGKKWRCSKNDIKFPKSSSSRRLVHVAVDHGVWPWAAHRALNDVLVLADCLSQVPDLAEQISREKEEHCVWEATDLPFERKDEAKARGFRWNSFKKVWFKTMTESETTQLPFRVQRSQ